MHRIKKSQLDRIPFETRRIAKNKPVIPDRQQQVFSKGGRQLGRWLPHCKRGTCRLLGTKSAAAVMILIVTTITVARTTGAVKAAATDTDGEHSYHLILTTARRGG